MPTFIGVVTLEIPHSTKLLPRTLKFLGFAHPFSGAIGIRYVVFGDGATPTNDVAPWKFVVADHGVVIDQDLSDWLVAGTEFVGGKLVTVFAKRDNPPGGS